MTIEQTVTIPADHRVFFEFLAPREIPEGKARVELKVTPVVEKPADRKATDRRSDTAPKNADERATPRSDWLSEILSQPTPRADALLGVLRGAPDMTAKQIREERLEEKWAKYLKLK